MVTDKGQLAPLGQKKQFILLLGEKKKKKKTM